MREVISRSEIQPFHERTGEIDQPATEQVTANFRKMSILLVFFDSAHADKHENSMFADA